MSLFPLPRKRSSASPHRLVIPCLSLLALLTNLPVLRADPSAIAVNVNRPVVIVKLSSIEAAYSDAKFLLELAGDKNGYEILRQTTDLFLGGVDTSKPCEWRMFPTSNGLQTVTSLPVASGADLRAFLQYLWDVDVKSAPAPKPALNSHVPVSIQQKLRSLKLQPNERIFYSLADGFLRHDAGYVNLGDSLEAVRLPWIGAVQNADEAIITIAVDGQSTSPDRCRDAFDKSRDRALSRLKKDDQASDAAFEFEKTLLDHQYTSLKLLVSESSQVALDWRTSHAKKQSTIHAEITPRTGTSLAQNIQRFGEVADVFAGVSSQNTVLFGSFIAPIDATLGTSVKSVIRSGRKFTLDWLERTPVHDEVKMLSDRGIAELMFDVIDEVASMSYFNGCIRTWSNGNGTLTTVAAVQIGDGKKYRDQLRQSKTWDVVTARINSGDMLIYKINVHRWQQDFAELFDHDGALFVVITDNQFWCAAGENALKHLKQALHEADGKSETKSDTAIDLHFQMRPLSETWSRIHARRHVDVRKKDGKKSTVRKPSVTKSTSVLASLDLPKLAAQAYQKGQDTMTYSLKRDGKKAILSVQFDAGSCRFAGQALSKFVKDYLE